MTTKSDLFYDPFAERTEKLEGIDFKFSTDREAKNGNGIGSGGSAEESHNEDEQVCTKILESSIQGANPIKQVVM